MVHDPVPARPGPGQVLLQIERFVLTSNNLTYARNGGELGYWAPFPSPEAGWGRVPAWGAARVVDGDPELPGSGELLVGFVPMATHIVVEATPLPAGLRATAPDRSGMYPLYRDMNRPEGTLDDVALAVGPGVTPSAAHLHDELGTSAPAQVVFSSATSRTALTTAVLLRRAGSRVVGLTASERVDVAVRAGVFDQVLPYTEVAEIPNLPGTAYVDVAGRPEITDAVHRTLGSALARSIRVGGTHASVATPASSPPPGPSVERFNVGLRRTRIADSLGARELERLEREAREPVATWAAEHLAVERTIGLEQARELWHRIQHGTADPLTAHIVVPAEQPPTS
ncbi:DUF2855 family protein [Amycolatopsis lurida]